MKQTVFLWTVLSIIACIFLTLSVGSATRESLTFDEIVHIEEGIHAWKKHTFDIDTNNPPLIRELAVIPLLRTASAIKPQIPNQSMFFPRMIIVTLSVLLGISLFVFSNSFFGLTAAAFSVALYGIDPNILANNHYVTQDVGAAFFFFLGYMSLVLMLRAPSWKTFFWHGICMGLMAATKITLLPYYAVSACMLLPFILGRKSVAYIYHNLPKILFSIVVCFSVIWGTYFFKWNVVIVPTAREGRVSDRVLLYAKSHGIPIIVQGLHFLQYQKIPLGDYIAVLKNTAIRSTQKTPTFFLGQLYAKPRWYFMVVNMLYKTPISLILLFLIGLWRGLRNSTLRKRTIILLIPVISILLVSMMSPMQPLVRYMLPIYPFILMIAGLSFPNRWTLQRYAVLLIFAWSSIAAFNQYPHFISYANEFSGPRESRYLKFSDSNLDWGQGLITLSSYIKSIRPSSIHFSYFGRDDANAYGFTSDLSFGSYKSNEICAFHNVSYPHYTGPSVTVISVSNWYGCGYNTTSLYAKSRIVSVVGDSFLVFSNELMNK